ncbi:MAG: suppressor of fused domain protein [Bacteroidota bacterium]
MDIVAHLESYLGEIVGGWDLKVGNKDIQAVKFDNHPTIGVSTYSTLGLSSFELNMPNGTIIRQEYFISAYDKYSEEDVVSFLLTFASGILSSNKAVLRGESIGPGPTIIKGSSLNGIYCSNPIFQDNEFSVVKGTNNIIMVWLMPIHIQEIEFVKEKGWNQFEDSLEKEYCDFWDLERKPLNFTLTPERL